MLEGEMRRQKEEFEAIKLTNKRDQSPSIRSKMAEVPKRPISMFTEDKRDKERPLTPVQEQDAASSIIENGQLKPVIKDIVALQIADALKKTDAKLEQFQTTKTEKIASLVD